MKIFMEEKLQKKHRTIEKEEEEERKVLLRVKTRVLSLHTK